MEVIVEEEGKIEDNKIVIENCRRNFEGMRNGMGGLERRDDELGEGEKMEWIKRIIVEDRKIVEEKDVIKKRMIGKEERIVEKRGKRMELKNLEIRVMEEIGEVEMKKEGEEWDNRREMLI